MWEINYLDFNNQENDNDNDDDNRKAFDNGGVVGGNEKRTWTKLLGSLLEV